MPNNCIPVVTFNDTNNKIMVLFQVLCISILLLLTSIQAQAKPEYIVGLTEQDIRIANIEDVELGFNYQLDKLSVDRDYSLKVKIYPNDSELQKLILQRKVIGYFGTTIRLFNSQNLFDHQHLYTPVINEQLKNRYLLLVRKDSGISQLSQLKQKNIAYCTADAVGVLFLQLQLKEKGLSSLDSFFSKKVTKKNPNLAISSAFFKEVSAALVLESDYIIASELNPQLIKQMIAIETSTEYVINVLAFSKSTASMPEFDIDEMVKQVSTVANTGLSKKSKYSYMKKLNSDDLSSVRALFEKTNLINGNHNV